MNCGFCQKRVPSQYREAHARFHAKGVVRRSPSARPRRRSAEKTENIRLSRIRHRQVLAQANA